MKESACFKILGNPSCTNLLLTNCSRGFQDTKVIGTSLSDFQKMNLALLRMFFSKQKHEITFYINYKKFDYLKLKELLNRELMKHDIINMVFDFFHETLFSISNAYTPLKN